MKRITKSEFENILFSNKLNVSQVNSKRGLKYETKLYSQGNLIAKRTITSTGTAYYEV